MSEITITVNDEEISKLVEEIIAKSIVSQYTVDSRDAKYGVRKGVENAVKKYIYEQKDAIIEKCVVRASDELARKGMIKLIEKLGG